MRSRGRCGPVNKLPSVLAHGTKTGPNGLSAPVEDVLWDSSTRRRQNPLRLGVRQMPSLSDRPKRCPNSRRVRVPDTQMHQLRPRVRRAGAHRPFEVRCSDRQRTRPAEVRPSQRDQKKRPSADATEAVGEIADHSSSGSNINPSLSTTLPYRIIRT